MPKPIPFDFVLEELAPAKPYTKLMFGCTSIYVGEKIVLILRRKDDSDPDNGLWLATTPEHHESLRADFPSMRSIALFGPGPTGWQVLPLDAPDFEEAAFRACALILKGDPRIGKVPKGRKPRGKAAKPKAKAKAKPRAKSAKKRKK
jgi:hypothetical protein